MQSDVQTSPGLLSRLFTFRTMDPPSTTSYTEWAIDEDGAGSLEGAPQEGNGQRSPDDSNAGRLDLTYSECTDLMLLLFKSLRGLSMDKRPEVRNSGIRTLFLAIGSHAARFDDVIWHACLWDVMFPLMKYVHYMSDTSSCQEAAAVELGKDKGRAVMMLVHHSKNSEQKQWDESMVQVLNGMTKVLKVHLPVVVHRQGFESGWGDLMSLLGRTMCSGRRGTVTASLSLVCALLQAHTPGGAVTRAMWKRALAACDAAVRAIAKPGTRLPIQARLELVASLAALYQQQRAAFDLEDSRRYLAWLDRWVRFHHGADDSPLIPGTLGPMQKALLPPLAQLAPVHLPDLWPDVFSLLLGWLCPGLALDPPPPPPPPGEEEFEDPVADPRCAPGFEGCVARNAANSRLLSAAWMSRALEALVALFQEHAPWEVQAAQLLPCLRCLDECMALRRTDVREALWRDAAAAFSAVVLAGLPAVSMSHHEGLPVPSGTWEVLACTFERFLLGECMEQGDVEAAVEDLSALAFDVAAASGEGVEATTCAEDGAAPSVLSAEDEELQASVLDTLTNVIVTASSTPPAYIKRLLNLLARGSRMTKSSPHFSQHCLRKLYVLCSPQASDDHMSSDIVLIARLALLILLSNCQAILRQYLALEADSLRRAGDACDAAPAPASATEAICVLEILGSLSLAPSVLDAVVQALPPRLAWLEVVHSRRQRRGGGHAAGGDVLRQEGSIHLLPLYSIFCQCITCSNASVRELVKPLLLTIGAELGL